MRVTKTILKCVNCVFIELQCALISLPSVINLINSIKNDLNKLSNYDIINEIYEKRKKCASNYDFKIDEDDSKNIKRKRNIAFNKSLYDYLVGSILDTYHTPNE